MNQLTYTENEFHTALSKWLEWYERSRKRTEKKAFLVAAQPGSGKTGLASHIIKNTEALFINGDEYRKSFPNYRELYRRYGDDMVNASSPFASRMTEALIDRLSEKGYNLVIEGTLRTTIVPTKTCELLKYKGYTVILDILCVQPEISYLRTLKRYEEMREAGTTPRKTTKAHHDLVVSHLVDNINTLYSQHIFDSIMIHKMMNEKFSIIYDESMTPTMNPSQILQSEHARKYSAKEIISIKADYGEYLSETEFQNLFASKIMTEAD